MMRYHYEKPNIYLSMYGKVYFCDHPVYHCCTLFQIGEKGLAVIQQRFDEKTKSTWWGEVDPWITDDLYLHPCFKEYFDMRSGMATNGLYPTVTIRQIMWALKMKPIKRERWETVFDRRDIQFAENTVTIMKKTFYRRLHYESEIKYFGKDANKIGMAVEQFIIYNWSVNS